MMRFLFPREARCHYDVIVSSRVTKKYPCLRIDRGQGHHPYLCETLGPGNDRMKMAAVIGKERIFAPDDVVLRTVARGNPIIGTPLRKYALLRRLPICELSSMGVC